MIFFIKSNAPFLYHKSFLIYKFSCECDVCYRGLTRQRLKNRIKQNVPPAIQLIGSICSTDSCNQNVSSSINQHLLVNALCANTYNPNMFTNLIVNYKLSVLEAFYMTKYQTSLWKQKEFSNLLLFKPNDFITPKPDLIQEKKIPILEENLFFSLKFVFFLFSFIINYLNLFLIIVAWHGVSQTKLNRKKGSFF